DEHGLPVENLLSPELLRRVTWSPPESTPEAVAQALRAGGARPWQVNLTAGVLAAALAQAPTSPEAGGADVAGAG
ncbi:MAG: ribonuclease D, partial [Frankiales bacterium]|nr:ribonuclease D [Frankiales bacterium]